MGSSHHQEELWDWDSLLLQANPLGEGELGGATADPSSRRRRDPRLACPNFLAGRVPCACSDEEDEAEEEERQRKRANRGGVRCQVPSCTAELTGLKGYHQRHRVCLTCANAISVSVDGLEQRYCQQCGKFHALNDFDEGKRSCRRKLERHNNRRRRKAGLGSEPAAAAATQSIDKDANVSDGSNAHTHPPQPSPPEEQPGLLGLLVEQDSAGRASPKLSEPSGPSAKRATYSSPCPTRRISFKFYDWNPADFPRRLRHQILEWLANMPVELEGYIRSGCTILTLYIAMPDILWRKLHKDWEDSLSRLINGPESGFWDKGAIAVCFDDKMTLVVHGTIFPTPPAPAGPLSGSIGPVLGSSSPICLEAGIQAMVSVFGTNLRQPNLRLLVGSKGKYLPSFVLGNTDDHSSLHVNIVTPRTFGVAFIEMGYEHGISNFVPLLIADKQLCEEVRTLEGEMCLSSGTEQRWLQELLVDLGWVVRHVQKAEGLPAASRLQQLLAFSVAKGWETVTARLRQALVMQGAPQQADPRVRRQGLFCSLSNNRDKLMLRAAMCMVVSCVALCILVQYPRQVVDLSRSLRRCLWTTK